MSMEEIPAVTRFREYLRIKTVHPDPDYGAAVEFLKKQAIEIGLQCIVMEVYAARPIVVMTWEGLQPQIPSIMLNSHVDVVPVFPEYWTHEPFEAIKTSDGKIYGRGTQDMKSVGMQYLEVVRILKRNNQRLLRTLHITFVPDEEIGGNFGMRLFLKTEVFRRMNVGFVLDEGNASQTDEFYVFYGDRSPWWLKVTCKGNPGHGSHFVENTAADKMRKIINKFLDFRDKEKKRLEDSEDLTLGDVTTINLTLLNGGVQVNVVPTEVTAVFDIRISPTVNLMDFEKMILSWIDDAGEGVTYEFLQKAPAAKITEIHPDNPWWKAFSGACMNMNIDVKCEIFPAATDSRFLRQLGYPALGFSPINNTPTLLHDHDEYLEEKVYLQGIYIYSNVIQALANVPPTESTVKIPKISVPESTISISGAPILPKIEHFRSPSSLPSKTRISPPSPTVSAISNLPPPVTDPSLSSISVNQKVSTGQLSIAPNVSRNSNFPRLNIPSMSNIPSATLTDQIDSQHSFQPPVVNYSTDTHLNLRRGSQILPTTETLKSLFPDKSNVSSVNFPIMGDGGMKMKFPEPSDQTINSEMDTPSTTGDVGKILTPQKPLNGETSKVIQ